jgi:RNA polymerase sigma-70 factor, ECF subfamily
MQTALRRQPKSRESFPSLCEPASLPEPSNEDLLAAYAKTGNQEAFGELVRRHERELYSYLRNILGDAHLAEDAFQATFLKLHLKCHQFEHGRRLRPWLYTIANNQAIDILRNNRRHRLASYDSAREDPDRDDYRHARCDAVASAEYDPASSAHAIETRQRISLALQKIPEKFRQVITLVVFRGLKYEEAAKKLGIPRGTVKSRMHKAMQCLHEALVAAKHLACRCGPETLLS